MSDNASKQDPAGDSRIFTSRGDFHGALRQAFEQAAEKGCREIFISDPDFNDWPLGERTVVETLTRWAYAHRKLTVLARGFDEFPRRHARWVEWRRQWAHVVECRACDESDADDLPTLLLAPGLVTVRLLDRERYRGVVSEAPADAIRMRDQLDAVLQRSEEAFPASTLGL